MPLAPDILDCKPVDGDSGVGMDKPDNGLAAAEDEGIAGGYHRCC